MYPPEQADANLFDWLVLGSIGLSIAVFFFLIFDSLRRARLKRPD